MKIFLTSLTLTGTLIGLLLGSFSSSAEENRLANSTRQNQTMYVDDKLWITVRVEPDSTAEKVAVIQSGIRMSILSYEEGADYAKVQTENNHTGWVLYRYLTPEPVASLHLARAEKDLTRLQKKNKQLNESLSKLKAEKRELDKHARALEKNNQSLDKDLNDIRLISSDAVQTHQQKQALQQELNNQKIRINKLDDENGNLRARLMLFTIGAAVIGLLVGLYVGTIPLRRNKRWRSMP